MAVRRRKRKAATGTRRRKAVNPRRRRRSATLSRRRSNPRTVRRRRRRTVAINPRRRRHRRARNPSLGNIGGIFKQMVYGAGGAILTRTGASLAMGFIPGSLANNQFAGPAVQAAIAVTAVRMLGGKFLGKPQGDLMMMGGLISAGLDLVNKFLPNIQGQLTSIVRAPVMVAPGVLANGAPAQALAGYGYAGGYADVEDVPGFAGFADVEDVDTGPFNNY